MQKYRITVLMGIYNCANTLQEALDSLYSQTYQNFKIILCDDGSTDKTLRIAEENARRHDNILVLRNEKNMGLNFTLNRCLDYADTEFVARMDGDDISLPVRFEKEIQFLDEHPNYAVVSAPMIYFDENGDFRWGKARGEVTKESFIYGTPISHAPSMSRTKVIKAVGGYSVDKRLLRVEDYHLWFKVFAAGYKLYSINEHLYKMRDDRNAVARRNWMTRKNEFYVQHIGYKMIGIPWYYQIYTLIPILKYFAPQWLYSLFHKK